MKVAVTGGLGFIPTRAAATLRERGHEVVLVDYADESVHPLGRRLLEELELRRCDLTDAEQTDAALADVDAVVHAAALGTKVERDKPRETLELNLTGTANAIEAARRGSATRFVFCSSAVVYGEGERGETLREDERIEDVPTIYAATKLAGEHLVRAYGHQFGLSGVSLRFMNVYGFQPETHPWRDLTAKVLENIEAGRAPVIHGDGRSAFDLIHVEDVARAVALAVETPNAHGELNVGTGLGTEVREVVSELLRLTGSPLRAELHPEIDVPVKRYVADVTRAAQELGFTAEIDLETGLRRTIEEFRAEREAALTRAG